jgi:prolyl-tRNA synthetase
MRVSKLFTKTLKNAPADEVAKNAQLLIRAGYVYKEMAGAYAYLPLGIRVVEKIKQIVREEMNAIDSNELIMTGLQRRDVWEKTGRWDDKVVDVWFKTHLQDGTEVGLGWSHEEPIVEMMKQYISSYKDLPVSLYQFQTKMRNELRAKSGIMRGREFIMKDMYSFHATKEDLDAYYEKVIEAYKRVYDRLGVGKDTYVTFASGGAFTKFSHEFQTITDAGEDVIYLHREKNIAVNEEVIDEAVKELGIARDELEKVKTAESGNIFNFGTQKTDEMGLYYTDHEGKKQSLYIGSYGIGVTRIRWA